MDICLVDIIQPSSQPVSSVTHSAGAVGHGRAKLLNSHQSQTCELWYSGLCKKCLREPHRIAVRVKFFMY
ncbi:hypothetical protein EMCG_04990 [[Emmonsia] crescens]|uniref:Uncharacterized protein n=1 Tax=[Emmonsia] crescens TaxID=73230 RepID=A0A0G2IY54_9EURO|nr:hypothetical protein EMCG_04990 [Emmonsia crescens UAMH 3008]